MITSKGGPLTPSDLKALAARWIDEETAKTQLVARVPNLEGAELVGRNGAGNYAGIAIPYVWPGEDRIREYRLRRDHPEYENGKPKQKYISPPGRGNMLYFAIGTDPAWLSDATLPLIIVEGEFKAIALDRLAQYGLGDAAERPRFLAVGIPGVWNWRGTIGKTFDASGTRVDEKGPISDLERLEFRKRSVIILFDRDVESNEKVQITRAMLAKELSKRGAEVKFFPWPSDFPTAKGIDDYLAMAGPEAALHLIDKARPLKPTSNQQQSSARTFQAISEDCYRLTLEPLGITFEIDRLRRERHELIGELSVHCDLPGTRSRDGNLSIADFNVSSARARSERAKLLANRANTRDLDWLTMVEEFCQKVLEADRAGQPAVDLRTLPAPAVDDDFEVEGVHLLRRHPTILFGDGGAAKSYLGLYIAGRLAERGLRVAIFDWELAAEEHRERLERLFWDGMPRVLYARCERPLVYEVDRLRRITKDNEIEFIVYDSIAFACDGPPDSAEAAGRYFRAVRQIGSGSLHIAHISKGENADQKPFGSAFWHNGARSTWYAQVANEEANGEVLRLGLFNRKANLGSLQRSIGFNISFTEDRTTFRRTDVADHPELATKLSVRERMCSLLRKGAMTPEAIADQIEADVQTVKRTQRRHKNVFVLIPDGRVSLLERHAG